MPSGKDVLFGNQCLQNWLKRFDSTYGKITISELIDSNAAKRWDGSSKICHSHRCFFGPGRTPALASDQKF